MLEAVGYVRRMRGGAQAHLMRCRDEQGRVEYYVVKFQNNPQHVRILANELLASRLAKRAGLPVPPPEVVEVSPGLIEQTAELSVNIGMQYTPCRPGKQFGSRYPGLGASLAVQDYLPDEQLAAVTNLRFFAGVLAVDKWLCNCNGRQAIFYREEKPPGYRAEFIDFGFCFNAGEWGFPDAPLRGLYPRHRVYDAVRGLGDFEEWIERIGSERMRKELGEVAGGIPPEFYEDDFEGLSRLVEQLDRRRKRVPDLILEASKSDRNPFVNWKSGR